MNLIINIIINIIVNSIMNRSITIIINIIEPLMWLEISGAKILKLCDLKF